MASSPLECTRGNARKVVDKRTGKNDKGRGTKKHLQGEPGLSLEGGRQSCFEGNKWLGG